MSEHEYNELWHYSERFTRDKLQRSELVTMAWKEGLKLGQRCNLKLMESVMHFRSKELKRRSAFPCDEMGKSTCDAWNHDRVYVDRKVASDGGSTLAEFLLPVRTTPLDYTIANDFMESLTEEEQIYVDDLFAGFSAKDISARNNFSIARIATLKQSVRNKAAAYL